MELQLTDVKKNYGSKAALCGINFRFHEGIYGILGANGAGKSTMLNLITDNLKRDCGKITYNGEDILEAGKKYRKVLGYMPQQQGMYEGMTTVSFLSYMAVLKGISRRSIRKEVDRVTEVTNLAAVKHDKINTFSGGMKQRVLLAQALLGNPRVLILDEPTAGLDPTERARIRDHIYKLAQNRIVLLATHIVSDIEAIADEILLMDKGKIIKSGTSLELIESLPKEVKPILSNLSLEDVYLYYLGERLKEND